jgi:hypothetical protein
MKNDLMLGPGEHVLADAHKHWFLIFIETFWIIVAILLPPLLIAGVNMLAPQYLVYVQTYSYEIVFFYCILLVFAWIIGFSIITDYILDVVRVTNKRIIDIDQKGFFSRNIASIRLDDVQDVTIDTVGLIPTLLKFGTIKIQSSGAQNEFVIKGVRYPQQLKEIILHTQNTVEEAPQKVTFT